MRSPARSYALLSLPVATVALLGLLPASAPAAIKAEVSISSGSGGSQIVATLSSSKNLKKRKRPTGVSVKGGGKTYKLSRKKKGLGAWKSRKYTGADAAAVAALAGQRVTVEIKSKSGKTSVGATVPGGTPAPAPAGKLFDLPAQELTGNDAFNAFSKYFLNSRFTDCPAGWPACAVEQRYLQCANGSWEYHRYTNVSGADINSYGTYQVTGAASHPDGSWGVEYVVTAYGSQSFYSWNVAANGTITGTYSFNGSSEPLGPLQYLAGGC